MRSPEKSLAVRSGALLWKSHPERVSESNLAAFVRWLELQRQRKFATYEELWRWSVSDLESFWAAVWDYFLIESSVPYSRVLASRKMPGAQWFPGARLNYAQHAMRHERAGAHALMYQSETTPLSHMSWTELGGSVRLLATQLRNLGVKPGDRVVACLPNIPEAVIAMLASASIGAVWSSCGPDFGSQGVLDRFAQLAPKVLFCSTSYQYGGRRFERSATVRRVIKGLTSLQCVICVSPEGDSGIESLPAGALKFRELLDHPPIAPRDFAFEQVPFDHPLWILFTSGTTGLPKPIVHGHGGILLEQLKHLSLNFDVHSQERIFFVTTTGWMMWNFLVSALLSDVVPVLYDGNVVQPDPAVLWKLIEDSGTTLFGTSPAYLSILKRQGFVPKQHFGLSKLRSVTLAGSPVSAECMKWCYENIKSDLWVAPGSGGTEVCTGFVGGVVSLPVYAGEIQARALGCAAYAFNDRGESVTDEAGELVITAPMPSMPLYFWSDPGHKRYLDAYFDRFPGVWRHGDLFRVNRRGGCFVLGRSDAALNRHGVRIGTAEIYRTLASVAEVEDALIVNLELKGGQFFMPLFIKLRAGLRLDRDIEDKVCSCLREEYSPRHVPDRVIQVSAIPYTRSGKKMEVPVKRMLMGVPPEQTADLSSLVEPGALDDFIRLAKRPADLMLRRRDVA
ncbi:MAG TPA: acetoacetate--CoA ligase [Steroidobacteraceae bacterium]|nr:acetoacetate--CoA ligase [Steroidobacteraceae bacterium]